MSIVIHGLAIQLTLNLFIPTGTSAVKSSLEEFAGMNVLIASGLTASWLYWCSRALMTWVLKFPCVA